MPSVSRSIRRYLVWLLAILFGGTVCTISFAQPNTSALSPTSVPVVLVKSKEGKGNQNGKGNKHNAQGESKGNKEPGKLKGLDRADEVAGEHGKQGRDNARAKQAR